MDPRRSWKKGRRSWTRFERVWQHDSGGLLSPEDQAKMRDFEESGVVETWRNNLYQVQVSHAPLVLQGSGFPRLVWLSLRRILRGSLLRDWRDLQRIKNEIMGPTREGVELYPSEHRLVDESDQTHLWVFANAEHQLPFGYLQRSVSEPDQPDGSFEKGNGSQRPQEFDDHHDPIERCVYCGMLPEHCQSEPELHEGDSHVLETS